MEDNWNAKTCLSRDWGNPNGNLADNETQLCPPIWDGFLCWGPTPAGTTASASCPSFKGSDITKSAFRMCSNTGHWLDRNGFPSSLGWTNYTPCLTPEIREIMRRLGSNEDAQTKLTIAANTRVLEFVGLSLSLAALLLSLMIFYYFRTLRNSRTRLHRHLFIAMVIQVGIRLIVYTDQAITRSFEASSDMTTNDSTDSYNSGTVPGSSLGSSNRRGIDNTPGLCEASYISLEYARTAMFMWMFVEGLFLHNMITVTVFEEKLSPLVYPIIGWIIPIPLTFAWALMTHLHYGSATCWWGYNFTQYFWILEGPRLAVLVVNLAFLLNILRVLVMKLRQSNSSETQQAMKAVKAALVLLPLLGLTNLLNMLDAPLEKSPFQFALWSYSTHLLTSTQGFILAFIYCFRNGEVQVAVRKFVRVRLLGNSKQITIIKKPAQLSALGNNSYLKNCSDVSDSQNSDSHTVNMLNGHATPVVIFTQNGHIHTSYHRPSLNNNYSFVCSKPSKNVSNSTCPKPAAYSSPANSTANCGVPTTQPPLQIVRSFSNGILKQTAIKPNYKHTRMYTRKSSENHCLLQKNNSNSHNNDHPETRPVVMDNPTKQMATSPNPPFDSAVTVTTLGSSSFHQLPSRLIGPRKSQNITTTGITSSSSWSCSAGATSSSTTSSSGCFSSLHKEHSHHHQPSTSSSLEFHSHSNCHPNNNSNSSSSSRINKLGKQIASSWGMLIIPEQLLKRMRGQQQTTNNLVSSPTSSFSGEEPSGKQRRKKISTGSFNYEVVAKEDISEDGEHDVSTTSSGGEVEAPDSFFSVDMISGESTQGAVDARQGSGRSCAENGEKVGLSSERERDAHISLEIINIGNI